MSRRTDKNDFDRYAKDYDLTLDRCVQFSGFSSHVFAARKVLEMRSFFSDRDMSDGALRILNFGCGIGASEPYLSENFPTAEIYSIDISEKSIEEAVERNRLLQRLHFSVFDGLNIPFSGQFNIVMMAGVLHHIESDKRPGILIKIRDILTSDGSFFMFEHNPWNPLTRRIVRDCPFDEDAELVSPPVSAGLLRQSGFAKLNIRFIHFFPAALGRLVPFEKWLHWLPIGAQYYYRASRGLIR